MNQDNGLCQFLEWDSNFFGQRIGRINSYHLDLISLENVLTWSKEHQIDCLYFQAAADDAQTIRLAEENQFHLVEIRLIFERHLQDWRPETRAHDAPGVLIRAVQKQDLATLQEIAAYSYLDSRYYFDRCFAQEKWQAYYSTWVQKSCSGSADMALVAEVNGEAIGYITGTINKDAPDQGIYELTGVRPDMRRNGVGQELFRSGLDWFVQHGVRHVHLATQGRNIPTQRMVQRNGFITQACRIYYHKWFHEC